MIGLNEVLVFAIIAVFTHPIMYLIGYARREKQHADWSSNARVGFDKQYDALQAFHAAEMQKERNVVRELEISLLKAGEAIELEAQKHEATERNRVKSDGYRKAVVQLMLDRGLWNFVKHSDVPATMLQFLMDDAAKHAIDPAVNQKAKNLFVKGVRKGAKQGREQMRKLMQKSIDNQAMTIEMLRSDLNAAEEDVAYAVKRKNISVQAVRNVLADKVALPSVRRSLSQAIIVETGRLRSIAAQQGE